jgi:hypothetical protein
MTRHGTVKVLAAPAIVATPVTSKDGRLNFSPPGESVAVSFGPDGFTATIGNEFVDHRREIR